MIAAQEKRIVKIPDKFFGGWLTDVGQQTVDGL
jgi:hypothetical protein